MFNFLRSDQSIEIEELKDHRRTLQTIICNKEELLLTSYKEKRELQKDFQDLKNILYGLEKSLKDKSNNEILEKWAKEIK